MKQLNDIKGIGPKTISLLNKLNIYDINDLIEYYPYRYEILKQTSLNEENVIISGIIESTPVTNYFRKINRLTFKLNIGGKLINVIIYNRAFLKNNLNIGKEITVIGKYEEVKNTLTASDIKLYPIGDETIIEPVYHLTKGMTNKGINKVILNALNKEDIIDYLPEKIIKKYNFLDKYNSLNLIHNPINVNEVEKAQERCKYEELFLFMLKINALKRKNNMLNIGYERKINVNRVNKFKI